MPDVLILMGSDSDAPVMQAAVDALKEFGISSEMTVASAHRSPARVMRLVDEAPGRGVKIFIVGAGAAAHLGGVVAAHTILPVIGVPIDSSALKGHRRAARDRADAAGRARGDDGDRRSRARPTPPSSPRRSSASPTRRWRRSSSTTRRSSPTRSRPPRPSSQRADGLTRSSRRHEGH